MRQQFQSAPPPLGGGDFLNLCPFFLNLAFQSAPPPLGGGDNAMIVAILFYLCFNPRPPRLEGATCHFLYGSTKVEVSIRAPPAWRGRPLVRASRQWFCWFQSAPPPLGGGDWSSVKCRVFRVGFNPRPPRLEGAT